MELPSASGLCDQGRLQGIPVDSPIGAIKRTDFIQLGFFVFVFLFKFYHKELKWFGRCLG